MITFEIALPGVISVMTEARHDDIASNGRPVPYPQKAVSKIRQRKAKGKALEAARSAGCPGIMKGYVGEDDGQHIAPATKIIFEWQHVRCSNGDLHLVHVRYENLFALGRSVPNSPMRLQGRPGLVYIGIFRRVC